MDYLKIVSELNDEIYKNKEEVERTFTYTTDGFSDIIKFGELYLWDSEYDGRELVEETQNYEPFIPFIKRVFNEEVDKLNNLKF